MASSPVTAPSRDSPSSPTPPSPASPPPTTSSPPPPPPTSSSPPPTPSSSSSPPPQQETSPPPPVISPPPPATSPPPETPPPSPPTATPATPPPKTSPPPSSNDSSSSPPPPPSQANPTPPPPPPASRSSSPPSSSGSLSPPPPTHKTPPSSHTTHSDSPPTHQESSSTTEKLPLIIGITAGAGLLFIVMIIIIVSCAKKKKRRRRPHDQMQFYKDPSREHKGSEYYKSPQHPNWHKSPQSIDQRVPQPPGAVGSVWPGPPPPPMMSSSEMSSNFSGPHHPPLPPPSPNVALGFNKSTFSYDELAAATNGFAQSNLLGQGGFGYVHKGILANGKEIAVKSLKSGSGQGEREFQAEVEIISRVHHRHLVSLVGYCIAGGQRLLVYEFVPNKTLEYHLHGPGCPTMDWPTRLRIALGSAKGLAYLHEDCHPRIIHRDIKAANILLDNKFEAMVADFGLAKLSSDNNTHVSTRVMGTFGYLAPEYASSGKLTEKSDVFSYGVMLLELITGRRPVDTTNAYMEDSLVDWARPLLTSVQGDGNYDELVDPRLENNYSHREMAQMVACAAASIRHSARRRPKMSQIVRALEGDVSLEDLNDGVKTSQSINSSSNGSSEYDTAAYNADMKKFRKMALASQEMGSSEYEATSDYGLKPSSSSDS